MRSHYDVLGVSPAAEDTVIRAAYRALAQKYHPDRNAGAESHSRMVDINEAFQVLTDPALKAAHDAELRPSEPAAPPEPARRTLSQHLASSGVREMTTENIYFAPNIPPKKLDNALQAYGHGIRREDVLVLVDDTVFGSGKDGFLVTQRELRFKEKFEDPGSIALDSVARIKASKNAVSADGRALFSLVVPPENAVGWLVHVLDEFVVASRRPASAPATLPQGVEPHHVEAILHKYRHAPESPVPPGINVNGTRPGYYVGRDIPATNADASRFLLGISRGDTLFGLVDLGVNSPTGDAFVVAASGIYSRCNASPQVQFMGWDELASDTAREDFTRSIFHGVRFASGREIMCSRLNTFYDPFGATLLSELAGLLRGGPQARPAAEPTVRQKELSDARALLAASFEGFTRNDVEEDLQRIALFTIGQCVEVVSRHIGLVHDEPSENNFFYRAVCAQYVAFVLALYSYSRTPADFVESCGRPTFLGIAALSGAFLRRCRDKHEGMDVDLAFAAEMYDEETIDLIMAGILYDKSELPPAELAHLRRKMADRALDMPALGLDARARNLLLDAAEDVNGRWTRGIAEEMGRS